MRLSLHTDYALRTLMYLASQRGRCHVADVAGFFRISKDHVAKVVQRLAHEGLVRSVRGVGGGIELARSPDTIRLGDVIERFEGGLHLLDCVKIEDVCVIQPHCRLKHVLAEAERIQLEYLNGQSLADVVRTTQELIPLTATS
jgi:Rrf2 family nitric oxide-sensitive transcriptional repressor